MIHFMLFNCFQIYFSLCLKTFLRYTRHAVQKFNRNRSYIKKNVFAARGVHLRNSVGVKHAFEKRFCAVRGLQLMNSIFKHIAETSFLKVCVSSFQCVNVMLHWSFLIIVRTILIKCLYSKNEIMSKCMLLHCVVHCLQHTAVHCSTAAGGMTTLSYFCC